MLLFLHQTASLFYVPALHKLKSNLNLAILQQFSLF